MARIFSCNGPIRKIDDTEFWLLSVVNGISVTSGASIPRGLSSGDYVLGDHNSSYLTDAPKPSSILSQQLRPRWPSHRMEPHTGLHLTPPLTNSVPAHHLPLTGWYCSAARAGKPSAGFYGTSAENISYIYFLYSPDLEEVYQVQASITHYLPLQSWYSFILTCNLTHYFPNAEVESIAIGEYGYSFFCSAIYMFGFLAPFSHIP